MSAERPFSAWFVGGTFAYGVILWVLGMVCAGAGHGVFFPFLVFSAPFGAAGLAAGAFGTPVLWTAFGLLVSALRPSVATLVGRIVLLVHYTIGLILAWFSLDEGQQERLWSPQGRATVSVSLAVYFGGQFWIWRQLVKSRSD